MPVCCRTLAWPSAGGRSQRRCFDRLELRAQVQRLRYDSYDPQALFKQQPRAGIGRRETARIASLLHAPEHRFGAGRCDVAVASSYCAPLGSALASGSCLIPFRILRRMRTPASSSSSVSTASTSWQGPVATSIGTRSHVAAAVGLMSLPFTFECDTRPVPLHTCVPECLIWIGAIISPPSSLPSLSLYCVPWRTFEIAAFDETACTCTP
jgi:hypothetical protein